MEYSKISRTLGRLQLNLVENACDIRVVYGTCIDAQSAVLLLLLGRHPLDVVGDTQLGRSLLQRLETRLRSEIRIAQ